MTESAWESLQQELAETTSKLVDLIRQQPPSQGRIRGMSWSSEELAAHLVTIPARYLRMIQTPEPFPVSLSDMNEREIAELEITDLNELGEQLRIRTSALLETLGDEPERKVPFFAIELPVRGLCGVLLGEYLLHGHDLAKHTRLTWQLQDHHARWALHGLLPSAMHTADPHIASTMRGTFGLHIRPDDDWTITVGDGRAELTAGRPTRADFRISADPLAFYLTGFGRTSRTAALLRGKIVGYGRKPWLAGKFGRLFRET